MNPAIQTHEVSVIRDGVPILSAVSMAVFPGEIVGLLGPSGAGKTTLMRVVMGLQRPTGGEVAVLGEQPGRATALGKVGYVTQAPSVYADLTAGENLRYFAGILGVSRSEIDRVAELTGLTPYLGRMTATLSGGQRSRVSLAAALLGNPLLLVLDEPTVGLDPVLRQELWSLFRTIAKDGGSLLVSSHVMDEAEQCDRLVLMREGGVIAEGAPAELKGRTKTDTVEKAFLQLVTKQS